MTEFRLLTPREIDVVVRLEKRTEEIGKELHMSPRLVENIIGNIFRKFKVTNRTAAALRAIQTGYMYVPVDPISDHMARVWEGHKEKDMRKFITFTNGSKIQFLPSTEMATLRGVEY